MQVTRERVQAEIAALAAKRLEVVQQVYVIDGAIAGCNAMLAMLDAPEPGGSPIPFEKARKAPPVPPVPPQESAPIDVC